MNPELKRGTLELVLLRVLVEKERYGYEMTSELAERSDGAYEMKEGSLYPVLYRLEEAGRIEPRWHTQERGVPRKYYRITAAGEEELDRLTAEWERFVTVMEALLAPEGVT